MLERNLPVVEKRFYMSLSEYVPKIKEIAAEEKKWLDARRVMSFEMLLSQKPWNKHTHNYTEGCTEGGTAGGRCSSL